MKKTSPHSSTRSLVSLLLAAVLSACSGGGGSGSSTSPSSALDRQAVPSPPRGQLRAGLSYPVSITSSAPGRPTIVFQVLEPATLVGGERYPLVLEAHSLGNARKKSPTGTVRRLVDAGYGVLSVDQRGHGDSGGTIGLMDPDREGADMVAVLDWAERNLDWLAHGPPASGGQPDLVLGAIGSSYGGAAALLLHAADPEQRLDALVAQATWNDLAESLLPSDLVKATGTTLLAAIGGTTRDGFTEADPLVAALYAGIEPDRTTNVPSTALRDELRRRGFARFCDGVADPGGVVPPAPGPVAALLFQGFRDTLFEFDEAYRSYLCLRAAGGDVRLLTHQSGHNAVGDVQDPGAIYQPVGNEGDARCGTVGVPAATVAFFDEHLKGVAGAADAAIPDGVCLSLSSGDAITVDEVLEGEDGTRFDVPLTSVVSSLTATGAVAVDLGWEAGPGGAVLAGIPRVELLLAAAVALPGGALEPVVFVGVGHERASVPGVWDLVDNQLRPLVGLGSHAVDLVGVAERLAPGDRLGLLLYGGADRFLPRTGAAASSRTLTAVGSVWLPLLG